MIIYEIKHLKETIVLLPIKFDHGNIGIVYKNGNVIVKNDHSPPSTIRPSAILGDDLYGEIMSKLGWDQQQVLIEMVFEGEVRK